MNHLGWLWLVLVCPVAYGAQCPSHQLRNEKALEQTEQNWAKALEQKDTATLGCILADEFEDADPDGKLSDRAATLAKAASHSPMHHELSEMRAHVTGDFGYIRGLATAIDAQGKVAVKVRFTDIYVYRDGRWQAVAGHESIVADTQD